MPLALKTIALLVGFHAIYDRDDLTTWATPGRIRKLVAQEGLASLRRLDDLIAQLLHTRHITAVSNESDRRIRILRPTELLLSLDRVYLAALTGRCTCFIQRRAIGGSWRKTCGSISLSAEWSFALSTAETFISRHPGIAFFFKRDAGYLAFLLVAQAALRRNDAGLVLYRDSAAPRRVTYAYSKSVRRCRSRRVCRSQREERAGVRDPPAALRRFPLIPGRN